jgi:hypothetical protein
MNTLKNLQTIKIIHTMEQTEGTTDLIKSPVVKVQMKSALSKNLDLWKLADIKGKLGLLPESTHQRAVLDCCMANKVHIVPAIRAAHCTI